MNLMYLAHGAQTMLRKKPAKILGPGFFPTGPKAPVTREEVRKNARAHLSFS